MKNTVLLFALSLFIFSSCNTTYVPANDSSSGQTKISKKQFVDEHGVCWKECLMPSIYEDEITTYNVFTGNESDESVDLEEISIEIKPASTQWVKKKADRNCLSADPNDCLVWCLVESPAETETFTILKDTSQSTNFEVKEIVKKKLIKKGGYVEKQKTICDDKVSADLVMNLQLMLDKQKYETGPPTQTITTLLKSGLYKYQKDNNLPVGILNLQTLDKLGVEYGK